MIIRHQTKLHSELLSLIKKTGDDSDSPDKFIIKVVGNTKSELPIPPSNQIYKPKTIASSSNKDQEEIFDPADSSRFYIYYLNQRKISRIANVFTEQLNTHEFANNNNIKNNAKLNSIRNIERALRKDVFRVEKPVTWNNGISTVNNIGAKSFQKQLKTECKYASAIDLKVE